MNKSLITNLLAILIIFVGYLYQEDYQFIIITGVFALSGSITNWLAIHMLFEKIPLLYGSGVILNKFEDIKLLNDVAIAHSVVHQYAPSITQSDIKKIQPHARNRRNIFNLEIDNTKKKSIAKYIIQKN